MFWQQVDDATPEYVRNVAEGWTPRPGGSRFLTFYGAERRLYCLCAAPATSDARKHWLELPYIE